MLRPQPGRHKLFVISGGVVDEPVDSSPNAEQPAALDMMQEQLGGVPRLGSLLGREQTFLSRRDNEQPVLNWARCAERLHPRNVSHALLLCKPAPRR